MTSPSFLHRTECRGTTEDVEIMSEILKSHPELLNTPKIIHQLPSSCIERDCFHLEIPLENFESQHFPLHDAVNSGHFKCVDFLINSAKIDVNLKTKDGETALACANDNNKFNSFENIVSILLENGAEVNDTVNFEDLRSTMIFTESAKVKFKNYHMVKKLLKVIFPINTLHTAVVTGNFNVLQLLLQNGAIPEPVIVTENGKKLPYFTTLSKICNKEIPMAICTRNYHSCENILSDACLGNKLPFIELLLNYNTTPAIFIKSTTHISEYSILKGSLKNENVIENIKLFHKYGAKLEINEVDNEVRQEIEFLYLQPRSLLDICRLEVRKYLGYDCIRTIDNLPIPETLKLYLHYKGE